MTPLIFILIALGWFAVAWAWARDRISSGGSRSYPLPGIGASIRTDGALAPPRTARMARRRRREVLITLGVLALCTFLLARAWPLWWSVNIVVDVVFVAFAGAVVMRGRPGVSPRRSQLGPSLLPDMAPRPRPGPRRETAQPEPALR